MIERTAPDVLSEFGLDIDAVRARRDERMTAVIAEAKAELAAHGIPLGDTANTNVPLRGVVFDPASLVPTPQSHAVDHARGRSAIETRTLGPEEAERTRRVDALMQALDAGRIERTRTASESEAATARAAAAAAETAEREERLRQEALQRAAFEAKQEDRRRQASVSAEQRSTVRKKYVLHISGRDFVTMESSVTLIVEAMKNAGQTMIEIPVGIPNEDKPFLMWINVAHITFIRPTS